MQWVARLAVLSFVFVLPWENAITLPGIGTVARLVGMLTILLSLPAIIARFRFRIQPFHIAVLLLFTQAWVSSMWAGDIDEAIEKNFTYLQLFVICFVMYQFIETEKHARLALILFALGAAVSAISAIRLYSLGVATSSYQRFASAGFDPNDNAIILSLGMATAAYIVISARHWTERLLLLFLPIGLSAIFLTGSRSGSVAVTLALLVPVFCAPRSGALGKVGLVGLLIVIVIVALNYAPEHSLARIGTLFDELGSGSFNSRGHIWQLALRAISDNPILGAGSGNFKLYLIQNFGFGDEPHNVFLAIAVEQGLFGLALFLIILFIVGRNILRMPRRERNYWLIMMAILSIAFMSLNWEWRKQTWLVLLLSVVHAEAVERRRRSDAAYGVLPDDALAAEDDNADTPLEEARTKSSEWSYWPKDTNRQSEPEKPGTVSGEPTTDKVPSLSNISAVLPTKSGRGYVRHRPNKNSIK